MDLLWYSMIAAYVVGAVMYFGLGHHTPRCPECHIAAQELSRQLSGSSPPVLEVVYRCPHCGEILWRRFVSTMSD